MGKVDEVIEREGKGGEMNERASSRGKIGGEVEKVKGRGKGEGGRGKEENLKGRGLNRQDRQIGT